MESDEKLGKIEQQPTFQSFEHRLLCYVLPRGTIEFKIVPISFVSEPERSKSLCIKEITSRLLGTL